MDRTETIPRSRQNARTLTEYFQVLNSADETHWEQAFRDTWHPEAIVHGRSCADTRASHLDLRRKGWVANVNIIRDIDGYQLEYTTTVGGKYDGPFVATFRDGRIYRVL